MLLSDEIFLTAAINMSFSNTIYDTVFQTRVIYIPSSVKHKYRHLALLFCFCGYFIIARNRPRDVYSW